MYRNFDAFGIILRALADCGYAKDFRCLNSADFGVPQTRRRLILIAIRGAQAVRFPEPTHCQRPTGQTGLFGGGALQRWNGWHGAIADFVDSLPESKFANWQLKRLRGLALTALVESSNSGQEWGKGYKTAEEPVTTVIANWGERPSHSPKAWLVERQGAGNDRDLVIRASDEPAWTVRGRERQCETNAFLVDKQLGSEKNGVRKLAIRDSPKPAFTVSAASDTGDIRSLLESGRVVAMTTRALGRFQSLPDGFQLSGERRLDCTGIGNGVPCLLAQRVLECVREQLGEVG